EGAAVYDAQGRMFIYRAWSPEGPVWNTINSMLTSARRHLDGVEPTFDSSDRGAFKAYYFGLHRGSQKLPMMSLYHRKHEELVKTLQHELRAVREVISGIFKLNFPSLYHRYCSIADFVAEKLPDCNAAFYPFASFAFNVGRVVTAKHKDHQNLIAGLCMIIPFGTFDYRTCCRFVVVELGLEFEVAAGVPIFIPSAMYTHYNTALAAIGVRESFVAWTGAAVAQWVDLGGRAVNELSKAEKADYLRNLAMCLADGLALFPRAQDS
ncbi:hypothetical protein BV25DRAFT_1813952, partial [Artomyces pyxidatus]